MLTLRLCTFALALVAITCHAPARGDEIDDVPSLDLRAGGDEMKRYFLIGTPTAKDATTPGQRLLAILPGGDGSADFNLFIRRVHKYALGPGWLVAQPVAPQWDAKQFDTLVWPTANSRYRGARFTTEDFVEAVVAEVGTKAKIDPGRVFILGWSSGGPPSYAAALAPKTSIRGAFVAMSIFKPNQLPPLVGGKGKPFYLLQSPDDQVTALRFAEAAAGELRTAGATVRFDRYAGGHGWQGDPIQMIATGVKWLDQQVDAERAR